MPARHVIELENRIIDLFNRGKDYHYIASAAGISKSAVIGKINRMKAKRDSRIDWYKAVERGQIRDKTIKPKIDISAIKRKTTTLNDDDFCQYPHGHVGDDDFRFCGAPVVAEKPYCKEHCDSCYVKPSRVRADPSYKANGRVY